MNRRVRRTEEKIAKGVHKREIEDTFTQIIKHLSGYDDRQPTNRDDNKLNKFSHLKSVEFPLIHEHFKSRETMR